MNPEKLRALADAIDAKAMRALRPFYLSETASRVYSVRRHRGGVAVPAPRRPQDDEPVPDFDANLAARWQG